MLKLNYQDFVDSLDQPTIQKLQTAVEIGRWESGEKLTEKQRDSALQAVMLWQAKNGNANLEEPFKVNQQGEFKVGKGALLKDVPLEFKSQDNENLIIKTKLK